MTIATKTTVLEVVASDVKMVFIWMGLAAPNVPLTVRNAQARPNVKCVLKDSTALVVMLHAQHHASTVKVMTSVLNVLTDVMVQLVSYTVQLDVKTLSVINHPGNVLMAVQMDSILVVIHACPVQITV